MTVTETGIMNDNEKLDAGEKNIFTIEATKKIMLRNLVIVGSIIFVLLFLRIVLILFGSDPSALFAGIIYLLSDIILFPFF